MQPSRAPPLLIQLRRRRRHPSWRAPSSFSSWGKFLPRTFCPACHESHARIHIAGSSAYLQSRHEQLQGATKNESGLKCSRPLPRPTMDFIAASRTTGDSDNPPALSTMTAMYRLASSLHLSPAGPPVMTASRSGFSNGHFRHVPVSAGGLPFRLWSNGQCEQRHQEARGQEDEL